MLVGAGCILWGFREGWTGASPATVSPYLMQTLLLGLGFVAAGYGQYCNGRRRQRSRITAFHWFGAAAWIASGLCGALLWLV